MIKKMFLICSLGLILTGCVIATPSGPVRGAPPVVGTVWINGFYNPYRAWIPGHWNGYVWHPHNRRWVPGNYDRRGRWIVHPVRPAPRPRPVPHPRPRPRPQPHHPPHHRVY